MNSMTMNRDLIADWQPQYHSLFGHLAIKLRHGLDESGLFTRRALGNPIEAAAASAWKKLGRQTRGDVVKRREFRIDPASASGLMAIAGE